MNAQRWLAAAVLTSVIAGSANAQAVQLKRRGATTGTGTVTVTHQGDATLVTVKASNADAKSLFQDIGTKSGARILVANTVSGAITASVEALPLETALQTVGTTSGLAIRKLLVPQSAAANLKAPAAAALAASLTAAVTGATVIDPASGKSVTLTFATTAPKQAADQVVVYLVVRGSKAGGDALQTAMADATESLSQLTTEQRMQALRDLQRQAFESMTPDELEKMRQSGPPPGGFGGGPGGGPGGPPPDGFGGGPGSPPPGQ